MSKKRVKMPTVRRRLTQRTKNCVYCGLAESLAGQLTFDGLHQVNVSRALRWHPGGISEWSVNDWLAAMGGEAGEALNAGKKHRRLLGGIQQHGDTPKDLAAAEERIMEELADVVIYADLVAARLGRSLTQAIVAKFNAISEREGFPERLPASPAGEEPS